LEAQFLHQPAPGSRGVILARLEMLPDANVPQARIRILSLTAALDIDTSRRIEEPDVHGTVPVSLAMHSRPRHQARELAVLTERLEQFIAHWRLPSRRCRKKGQAMLATH